ncbi:hypothetical protein BCR32DRAFT_239934 [Anaeromyces robustus]|uniref:G-protein coupled receptors family 3 profile domain-containing protein n=1 Tax=Anaeromyces robustus TaxID=1754192 RepID=A0A1Y1XR85_9FUNG|nr:hypothetical protein BCR32DRAFT_239934 [Anaeromyces robustus]|eukprot:ORX87824.1 hypothetical protein BCR32DRAFT_239934 [Anaeromyces robustus]
MSQDSESSLCSALEFIDSYRDDINSEFPGYISQNAIDGFNKLKEVKEKTSSTDELYQLKDNEVINYIKNGGALFITFWDSPIFYSDNYIVSKLPARRSKFSSTYVHYVLRNSLSPNDYISYSRKFRKIFFNFIYGNETSENTLQKLENITKINYIELNSVFGLTVILISTIGIASTVVSTLLVGDERYKQHFNLLESYQWFFYSLGIIILFSYGYTEIGKVTDFKCHLQEFITQTGYTFCMIPIFLKLIIIIPKRNNFSQFVKKNFTTLVFLFFVVDGIFFGFQFISSYTPVTVYVENGLNFQVCKINMNIGKIILWIIAANKFIVLVIILILLFIEWNVKYRYIHIKELANLIYTDLIGFIMIIIVHFLNVNNIHTQLLLKLFPIYFFTIVNLFLTFIIKILSVIFKEDDYITKYQNNNNNSNNSSNKSSISSDEIIEQINSKSQYEPSVNLVTSEYKIENIENWSSENNCANDGLQK